MTQYAAMPDFALEFLDITCTFKSPQDPKQPQEHGYTAVANTTLRIRAGEFVSVVGPTGCGKSTLLNVGAGLLAPSSGTVKVFGEPLKGINTRAGYMFQSEALMPWRSAIDNVMVGLQYHGVPDAEAEARRRRGCSAWAWASLASATRISSRAACASARRWPRCWRWTPTSS